jgi:hypothetical protein
VILGHRSRQPYFGLQDIGAKPCSITAFDTCRGTGSRPLDNFDETSATDGTAHSSAAMESRWKLLRARSARVSHLARVSVEGVRNRRAFHDVEHFVLFIGYPHSGSTLVGSLLNAHPDVVISQEANILQYVKPGVTRQQLFALVLEGDRRFAAVGRRWMHIDYSLPGTHQGTFDHLRVIGDKMAQRASRQIHADPSVLDRLRRTVRVPIRVLYLTRNPFDNIASIASPSMTQRPPKPLSEVVERYRDLAVAVDDVRRRLKSDELLTLSYESVSADPAGRMADICRFIGVDATESFLETCARTIRPGASRSRDRISWPPEERRGVEELIATHPTLEAYTFDA